MKISTYQTKGVVAQLTVALLCPIKIETCLYIFLHAWARRRDCTVTFSALLCACSRQTCFVLSTSYRQCSRSAQTYPRQYMSLSAQTDISPSRRVFAGADISADMSLSVHVSISTRRQQAEHKTRFVNTIALFHTQPIDLFALQTALTRCCQISYQTNTPNTKKIQTDSSHGWSIPQRATDTSSHPLSQHLR